MSAMTILKNEKLDVDGIPASEIEAALETILASGVFVNAPRMCRLLRFLVEKAISGTVRDTSEYVIGLEVFDRDPSAYSVTEDPIVRVQVGRLREKLKIYYSTLGAGSKLEISIPVGSYMPVIKTLNAVDLTLKQNYMLVIYPFKCISYHGDNLHFMQGLDEELMYQLFKAFGKTVVPYSLFTSADNGSWSLKNLSGAVANHRLEGSVQIDSESIRASIRVVDVSAGCIAWAEQFNRDAYFAIKLQEELASSICGSLKNFFGDR